jgi:lipase
MSVLHFHEFGDPAGELVLAVHGITAHGRRFRRLAEEAWPERRTIAVDLRGHGRSTYDGPWSIPQHVTDLIDTMDALGVEAADLVVHSYGGAIALALLGRAPERVRRLVLLDPALALDGAEASEAALGQFEPGGWASIEDATAARQGDLGDEHAATIAEEIAAHLVEGDDGRYRFRFHKPAIVTGWGEMSYPLPDALPAVPALIVVCDKADIVTPEALAGLKALLGEHLQVEHLDSGHMLYWEAFDATASLVTDFLAAR